MEVGAVQRQRVWPCPGLACPSPDLPDLCAPSVVLASVHCRAPSGGRTKLQTSGVLPLKGLARGERQVAALVLIGHVHSLSPTTQVAWGSGPSSGGGPV